VTFPPCNVLLQGGKLIFPLKHETLYGGKVTFPAYNKNR
jgi:hypothetical protein